ncbi:MAG: nucleotidyltransferase domain-containing protein [Nitrospirota bacterium]
MELGQAKHEWLGEVVAALEQRLGSDLVAVVLFGSHARGDHWEESDWDLLVIARNLPASPFERSRGLRAWLPPARRAQVSLLAKTPQEFDAGVPSLWLDIALDGVVLYDPLNYATERLGRLRRLIDRMGLIRERRGHDLVWRWKRFPGFAWSFTWEQAS